MAGIIFDGHGRKMSPSHTVQRGKRYRYYITHPDKVIADTPAWRLPAQDIEKRVINALTDYLCDKPAIGKLVGSHNAERLAAAITRCQHAAEQLQASTFHRRTKVSTLISRVDIDDDAIKISLSSGGFADLLRCVIDAGHLPCLSVPVARMRKGCEIKLVITEKGASEPDDALVTLLREALAARDEVLASPQLNLGQIASSTGRCSKRMTRLLRLSWLAPEIVDAILAGKQPQALTPKSLLATELSMDWSDQKAALGF